MTGLLRRNLALALLLGCGGGGGSDTTPSETEDGDDDGTEAGSDTETTGATSTGSTSSTTDEPTGPPDWTTDTSDGTCINMDGSGPCYVETLIPIPSVNLVYGDFSGDGNVDFAVVDEGNNGDEILFFGGTGGGFEAGVAFPYEPAPTHMGNDVSLGDLRLMKASGADRLFVQGTYGGLGDIRIDMWWTDGPGVTRFFEPTQSPPLGPWFGNFDGAGGSDLVLAPAGVDLDPLEIHSCDGSGCADGQASSVTGAPGPPWTILAGEVTGDSRADVVVVTRGASSQAIVLEAMGNSFAASAPIELGASLSAASMWLEELTGDNRLDLLVASDGGDSTANDNARDLHLFAGDGAGGFSEVSVLDAELNVVGLTFADFDGDNIPDLIARRHDTEVLDVFLGDGTGFALGPRYQISQVDTGIDGEGVGPWPTYAGDIDDSGEIDVLTAVESSDGLAVAVLRATMKG